MAILREQKDYFTTQFASEKIPVVEVPSLDEFGHYLALHLLLWIQNNPSGVISLPTGRTPESFIRALEWYKLNWSSLVAQENLRRWGIDTGSFPETSDLRFVQIDEFLWMSPQHVKSYSSYVLSYYIDLLSIPKENCLLVDFSKMGFDLDRVRGIIDGHELYDLHEINDPCFQDALQKVEQFCEKYEQSIQLLGGIGYFLGGIGLDGHIAFNVSGSSKDSVTRIVELNKKSKQGFNQKSRYFNYAVTIGLKTILQNPDVSIVLGAVGKEKASIVQKVIEGPKTVKIPASCLQGHKNSRFVVTSQAAHLLSERNRTTFQKKIEQGVWIKDLDRIVTRIALIAKKRIIDLKQQDFFVDQESRLLLDKIALELDEYLNVVVSRLKQKIERGLQGWGVDRVLHTAPHHDDIMLGYYSTIARSPQTDHQMMYVVSGSNGISDEYLYQTLKAEKKHTELIDLYEKQGGFVGNKLATSIKMEIREQEADLLWQRSGVKCRVEHMRSPFYNASYFKSQPTYDQDVAPCVELMDKFSPGLVLVLNDSEFQGPNTHHASFKIVMDAIKVYDHPVQVWGYRNVWDRYQIDEASVIVPVSQKEYDQQHELFVECFASQKKALYPSKSGAEPFSVYAQQTQKDQHQELLILLGCDYFDNHTDQRMRSAAGFILFEKVER